MEKIFFVLGCIAVGVGVAAGAFAAHGLSGRISPESMTTFQTGVRYQLVHGLALLAVAWAAGRWPGAGVASAGWFFLAGMVVFSGSLYLLALGAPRWLGAVTPVGGLSFLVGWAVLAWRVARGE